MSSGEDDRKEQGFTLVELVVVVLILGVLMAIAIPTFVSLTGSARSTGAESNVEIAATDEAGYFQLHQSYGTSTTTPTMASFDSGINWQTCSSASKDCIADAGNAKDVYVHTVSDDSYLAVVIGGAGTDGKDYWEMESQDPSTPSPEYDVTTSSVPPTVKDFAATASTTWAEAGG